MGANVTNRRARQRTVVVPGSDTWERWEAGDHGWTRAATGERPSALGVSRVQDYGVPAAGITTLAAAVIAPDVDALRGAVSLQMERRGITSDEPGHLHVAEVAFDGERRFGLGLALTQDTLAPKDVVAAGRCCVAATMRAWPQHSLLFWKELGSVVLGVSGENGLLYFHALGTSSHGQALLLRARCHILWLMETGWLHAVRQVAATFPDPSVEPLAASVGFPFVQIEEPPLAPPKPPWPLTPSAVVQREQQLKRARRLRGALTLAAAAILVAAAILALQIVQLQRALDAERSWLATRGAELDSIREMASRWGSLEAAISPQAFPLELLQRCASLLPPEGARFTSFEWSDGVLTINGESVSSAIAYGYLDSLRQNDATSGIQWSMAEPDLQTNNLAVFDIQGRTAYAQALPE